MGDIVAGLVLIGIGLALGVSVLRADLGPSRRFCGHGWFRIDQGLHGLLKAQRG